MKKIFLTLFILFVLISLFYFITWCKAKKLTQAFDQVAEHLLSELDERAMLGQIFFLYLPGKNMDTIFEIQPGSLFLQKMSIPTKNGKQEIKSLRKKLERIIQQLQEIGAPPPFVATDQEFGRVQRITEGVHEFPSAMAMGYAIEANKNFKQIYWVGFHSCSDLKKLNINWPLAPVADIHDNSENPVIGTRSFGESPKLVSKILWNYVHGLHDGGCMSTLKHFPGHGGTLLDSHKELPVVEKSLSQLELQELVPFRSLSQLTSSIMLGHIYLPKVDSKIVPFSTYWLQTYLRKKLNFKGLIITDDLGMRAVTPVLNQKSALRAAKTSLESGADILLLASGIDIFAPLIFDFLLMKIKEPDFRRKITHSVKKILTYKLKLGLYESQLKNRLFALKSTESITKEKKNIRKAMTYIMKYYEANQKKKRKLAKEAPAPQEINEALSQDAIRYIRGRARNMPLSKSLLVTDVPKRKFHCLTKENFAEIYFSFDALASYMQPNPITSELLESNNNFQEIIILHKSHDLNLSLKKFLRSKGRPPVTFLTVMNPFPYSRLNRFFHDKRDRLVMSFSGSSASKKALEKSLCRLDKVKESTFFHKAYM